MWTTMIISNIATLHLPGVMSHYQQTMALDNRWMCNHTETDSGRVHTVVTWLIGFKDFPQIQSARLIDWLIDWLILFT